MSNKEVSTEPTVEQKQRALELRELARRAEQYRLNRPLADKKDFSFRRTYFKEAEHLIA